jgi:EmrB/QacA subfamily drug resistance transporter
MEKTGKIGWITLFVVSLSAFVIALDTTFMNVAITTLVKDLDTTVGTIQAIIAVYALTMASLMLIGGKLQDVMGKKRAFLIGAIIYGIGTSIAALSVNAFMLLIGWSILEGIGAALMTPATASIITGTYHNKDRTFALAIWSAMAGVAAAIGPLFGGFLTTFFSWRLGFGLELVIIIAILLYSGRIKSFKPIMNRSDIDIMGALLSSGGIILLVLGILLLNSFTTWGYSPYLMGAGILVLITFYFFEKRRMRQDKIPLFDVHLLKNRNFSLGTSTRLLMNLGLAGTIFVLPVFLQAVTGADAFTTGLILMPLTVGLLIFSIVASKISGRLSHRTIISLGFLVALMGSVYLRYQFNLNTQLIDLVPGMFCLGVGLGLSIPLTADVVLTSAGDAKQADASGFLTTGANLGSSMGTAVIGVILILGAISGTYTAVDQLYPDQMTNQQIKDDMTNYFEKLKTTNLQEFKNQTSKASQLVNSTITTSMRWAMDGVSIFMMIGLILSLLLRPIKTKEG